MVVNASFLRFLHERGNVFLAEILFCLWLCLVLTFAFCLLFFYGVILFHQNPWGFLMQYRYLLVAWLYFHPAALHHWDKDGIYPQVHKIPCNGMTLSLVVNGLTFCSWASFPSINAHRCVWCRLYFFLWLISRWISNISLLIWWPLCVFVHWNSNSRTRSGSAIKKYFDYRCVPSEQLRSRNCVLCHDSQEKMFVAFVVRCGLAISVIGFFGSTFSLFPLDIYGNYYMAHTMPFRSRISYGHDEECCLSRPLYKHELGYKQWSCHHNFISRVCFVMLPFCCLVQLGSLHIWQIDEEQLCLNCQTVEAYEHLATAAGLLHVLDVVLQYTTVLQFFNKRYFDLCDFHWSQFDFLPLHCTVFHRVCCYALCCASFHFYLICPCRSNSVSSFDESVNLLDHLRFNAFCIESGLLPHDPSCFSVLSFDQTLGFPGEGPWSLMSANIDAFHSHPDCVQWDADVIALQETRLSCNNITDARHKSLEFNKDIFFGKLLTDKKNIKGVFKVPHGGTAFLAPSVSTRNFHQDDDVTGTWTKLQNTTRVSAIWHQVMPKLRVLVFSFYGQASLAHDAHLAINQNLLTDIFLVASQFGSVPIIIAGDFQSDPDCYQAIADAKALGFWYDPLVECNDSGEFSRPITFSRGGNFKNPTEHFSSIDGILMNDVALSALSDIRVCFEHGKQHAPIKAVFQWPRIFQKGNTLVKPAAFDLTEIPKNGDLNLVANQIWNDKYSTKFENADDETAWGIVNSLAIDTLKTSGAKFGRGPKQRGGKLIFKQVVSCPGQSKFGNATSKLSCYLSKTFQLVTELRHRLLRHAVKYADFVNTWNLQQKVQMHLLKIDSCRWWNPEIHLHDDALKCVLTCLHDSINRVRDKEKRQRIANWKRKMTEGTKSKQVDKFVFAWIKSKAQQNSPNLIRDSDGDIIVDPDHAILEINNQWDQVFAANVLHSDPMEVLKFAWPHVQSDRCVAEIPPVTGNDLRTQAIRRKIDAAPGLDGWRTSEMKMLPTCVYDVAAMFFEQVEQGKRQLPSCLTVARQVILDKKGDSPLQKRLISLLPIFLLCYTSLRYRQLQQWQQTQMPPQLFGGIKNRQMSQLQTRVRLSLDDARQSGNAIIGVKLDKAKCFDRLVPTIASALMIAFGVPIKVVMVFSQLYAKLQRFLAYKGWISPVPTTCANGVVQGDSLSLIAINVHMALWVKLIDKLPGMFAAVYVDDSYLWTRLENCRILKEAINLTENWDTLTGQLVNRNKSSTWASSTAGRKMLTITFPEMVHEKVVEILGARIQTCNQKATAWDINKTQKIVRDLKSIKALPCPVAIKEHIIGMKISPQLTFVPHLSAVPKKDLKCVQDHLVSIV